MTRLNTLVFRADLTFSVLLCMTCMALGVTRPLFGQDQTVRGVVRSAETRQPIPFCYVHLLGQQKTTTTDEGGRFALKAGVGDSLVISSMGFERQVLVLPDTAWGGLTVLLTPSTTVLGEVKISDEKPPAVRQFESVRSGEQILTKGLVLKLPALAGEPDFIKALTLLPGATKGQEGTSDFFIRGGGADQNLVMLDGATVYNTGHLFGFLSVFNPSAVGEVSVMSGGFPAQYGGRLSSIIDVRSKRLNKEDLQIEGGVGLISSRFSVEVPIIQDKLAVQIAGRRTYADQVASLVGIDLPYYFYDLNANVDWNISPKSRLYYGFYLGDDVLDFALGANDNVGDRGSTFTIGNVIQTLSLDHQYGKEWYSTTNLYMTRFDYDILSFFQDNFINVISDIRESGLRHQFTHQLGSPQDALHFGFSSVIRTVDPNLINSGGQLSEFVPPSEGQDRSILESAIFGEWEFERGQWQGMIGMRVSSALLENSAYYRPEPRLSLRWALSNTSALKASYTRMSQYIHRVSSSSFALPTDVWYPVDETIKPQSADQVTLGISRLLEAPQIVISSELYYKRMYHLIEFKEATNLLFNNDFEDALLQGDGHSYGWEFLVRKDVGRLKGWLAYTLSWTNRRFEQLNEGRLFPARYDRRHNLSLVGNYQLSRRWEVSVVWEFLSGARFTPVIGYYAVPNTTLTSVELIPIFPERNSVALADSHRLDLSLIRKGKQKPGKRWHGEWQFSIYNAYNRATPVAIDIVFDEATGDYRYEQPGLFGMLPSVSYHFTFK